MNDTTSTARDPAEIERDIRQTQEEMSRTVNRIGDQLTPRSIINALFDKAESNDIDARYLLDGARRNPLALAMIAGGAIWLISDSDAKLPSLPQRQPKQPHDEHADAFHRDYIAHMERVQLQADEDRAAYQRRRDLARANYFMLEQGHDEDEGSFRKRLDDMTERFRAKRHAWADAGHSAAASIGRARRSATTSIGGAAHSAGSTVGDAVKTTARGFSNTASTSQEMLVDNPAIGGLIAAAVGALAGAVLPTTRTEEQRLGGLGQQARDMAGEQKERLTGMAEDKAHQLLDTAREKKDELVERVQEHGQASGGSSGQGAVTGGTQPSGGVTLGTGTVAASQATSAAEALGGGSAETQTSGGASNSPNYTEQQDGLQTSQAVPT
jgi:gas vesicle protein